MIFVTGGADFIGPNFALDRLPQSDETVLNFDKPIYAGNPNNSAALKGNSHHIFVHGDIFDGLHVAALIETTADAPNSPYSASKAEESQLATEGKT